MTSGDAVQACVTTSCRSCLRELVVPVTLFERRTAVDCHLVGQDCDDARTLFLRRRPLMDGE